MEIKLYHGGEKDKVDSIYGSGINTTKEFFMSRKRSLAQEAASFHGSVLEVRVSATNLQPLFGKKVLGRASIYGDPSNRSLSRSNHQTRNWRRNSQCLDRLRKFLVKGFRKSNPEKVFPIKKFILEQKNKPVRGKRK